MKFLKNTLIGAGGIIAFLAALIAASIFGAFVWLILSVIGIVGYGLGVFLVRFILITVAVIFVAEIVGELMSSKASK